MAILVFLFVLLLVLGVVGIALVSVAVSIALHILRALLELVATVLPALCWSVGVGVASMLHFGPSDDGVPYGILAGVLTFPVASYVITKRRERRRAAGPSGAPVEPIVAASEPRPTDLVAAAWWEAERAAPAEIVRIAAARRSCDSVLDQAAMHPLEWALVDCAAMIRRNLPELVQSAIEAQAEGGVNVAAGLVEGLEDMAAEARHVIGPIESARHRFKVLRTHLANRRREAGV